MKRISINIQLHEINISIGNSILHKHSGSDVSVNLANAEVMEMIFRYDFITALYHGKPV